MRRRVATPRSSCPGQVPTGAGGPLRLLALLLTLGAVAATATAGDAPEAAWPVAWHRSRGFSRAQSRRSGAEGPDASSAPERAY